MTTSFAKAHSVIDSYYEASAHQFAPCPQLTENIETDVCIIGGGYTGLSTALHLAQAGINTLLLEANSIGWGASGRNGGHVCGGQRISQMELENKFGHAKAERLWHAGAAAVKLVEELIDRHQIQCDLKQGILRAAAKAKDIQYLREETEFLKKRYQYEAMRFVAKDELEEMLGSQKYYGGQLDMGSRHLHPLNFCLGLARAAQQAGALLYENSRVLGYEQNKGYRIRTAKGTVHAKTLVLACNGYLEKLEPKVASKIMPINNFVLATEPLDEALARELIRDDVAVQDTLFVINYWKLSGDNRLLFGGGENYTSKFPSDIKAFVRKYMLRVYPQLESTKIDYAWGGTLAITLNRMPHFGQLAPNHYFAQGYSGHGVATATYAGKLIADAIAGESETWRLFTELPIRSFPGGTLLRWPGLVAGMLYYSLLDKL